MKHFSHIHRLILGEVREVNLYVICYGCKQSISGVVYWCDKCDWYLHKRCAELPKEIIDPLHPNHLLTVHHSDKLYLNLMNEYIDGMMALGDIKDYICSLCKESRRVNRDGFFYRCKLCKFYICFPCFLEERRITPEFHEHPLTFIFRPASFYCNACDEKDKYSSSYICHICPFWIHKSCASFLSTIQFDDQHHPLTLLKPYSFDVPLENQKDCRICGLRLTQENWLYYCVLCHYKTHVRCSIPRSKLLRDGESENEEDDQHLHPNLLHFPLTDDFVVLPKHSVEQISRHEDEEIKRETKIKHKSHKDHKLIVYDGHGQNNTEMIQHDTISSCDICVQPISLPFYTCVQCNHFIHLSCANLPAVLLRPNHIPSPSQGLFFLRGQEERHSLFRCTSCDLYGNGFSYRITNHRSRRYRSLHLECAFLPNVILHETQRHPLVQIRSLGIECRACHVMSCAIRSDAYVRSAISVYVSIVLFYHVP